MDTYSYHVFYFPFRWSLRKDEGKLFSEQVDLAHIPVSAFSMWERVRLDESKNSSPITEREEKEANELFGERQYFFEFVHPVLYDIKDEENTLIYHYERREPKEREVEYVIRLAG